MVAYRSIQPNIGEETTMGNYGTARPGTRTTDAHIERILALIYIPMHGTIRGWALHKRLGKPPCPQCQRAATTNGK